LGPWKIVCLKFAESNKITQCYMTQAHVSPLSSVFHCIVIINSNILRGKFNSAFGLKFISLHIRDRPSPLIWYLTLENPERPIYFWNRLLNAVVLQKIYFFHPWKSQNEAKLWFSLKFTVLLPFHNFFDNGRKYFSVLKNIPILNFQYFEVLIRAGIFLF